MEIDLILNELSLQNPAPNEQIARQLMSCLIQTIKAVKAQSVKINLRTKDNFHTTILAPNYPLRCWFNDKEVDQVERSFIKTLATKTPFSSDLTNLEILDIENNVGLSEFRHQGEPAIGLAIAHVLAAIAISLLSEERWNCSHLQLQVSQIDDHGKLIDEIVEIIHASSSNHVKEHAAWIQNRIRIGVINGSELWNRREELFPNLEFCENVGKQMESLGTGNPMLQQVVKAVV